MSDTVPRHEDDIEALKRANDQRQEETSARIEDALKQIAADPSLATSASGLARLAGVSRQTLYNRGWPISRLKEIRKNRAAARAKHDNRDSHAGSRRDTLPRMLHTLQTENALLFNRIQDVEDELRSVRSLAREVERERDYLREQLARLSNASRSQLKLVKKTTRE